MASTQTTNTIANKNTSKPKKEATLFKKLIKNRLAAIGLFVIAFMIIMAIFAPIISTHNPNEMDVTKTLLGPGVDGHLLGTDNYGRDIFSRLIYGSQISLIVGIAAVLFGAVFGSFLGLISGYFGGKLDSVIMRIMDGVFAFPFILLAITLMTALGQGLMNVILAIGIANIPGFARLVRGQVLSVKEEEYIEVTKSLGAEHGRVIFHHILPNCSAPLIEVGS